MNKGVGILAIVSALLFMMLAVPSQATYYAWNFTDTEYQYWCNNDASANENIPPYSYNPFDTYSTWYDQTFSSGYAQMFDNDWSGSTYGFSSGDNANPLHDYSHCKILYLIPDNVNPDMTNISADAMWDVQVSDGSNLLRMNLTLPEGCYSNPIHVDLISVLDIAGDGFWDMNLMCYDVNSSTHVSLFNINDSDGTTWWAIDEEAMWFNVSFEEAPIINNTINITIASPQNTTYTTSSVPLDVFANDTVDTWLYNLNGTGNVTFSPNITLTLGDGLYDLIVFANNSIGNQDQKEVSFTVNVAINNTINITIYSPMNTTYTGSSVPLQVSANDTVSKWWYYLNGGSLTYFTPNTTITAVNGSNSIDVFANNTVGNSDNETVYFTAYITIPAPTPSPFTGMMIFTGIIPIFLSIIYLVLLFETIAVSPGYSTNPKETLKYVLGAIILTIVFITAMGIYLNIIS